MTASFDIVDTTEADIPAITAIYAEAVLNGTASFELDPPDEAEMLRRFRAIRDQNYPYISAHAEDGSLLGYAYASAYRSRPAYRWTVEDSVYIGPGAQGRGLGRALLAEIINRCEALGFRQMIAVIGGADHLPSIRLHEALGFAHAGVLRHVGFKHGSWLDTVMMDRPLGDGDTTSPNPGNYPGTLYRPR